MAKNQIIKNPPYDALDIIGVMICAKFYSFYKFYSWGASEPILETRYSGLQYYLKTKEI